LPGYVQEFSLTGLAIQYRCDEVTPVGVPWTGVKAAKARGVKFGRKRKPALQQMAHARKLVNDNESPGAVAAGYSVSRATLYRALAGYNT